MIMTAVARRLGLLDAWADRVDARSHSIRHLFALVFGLGVLTSAALSNDAAILLLTPLVVALVRRRHPDRPDLVVPFAFAVFLSAGVAPLPVSNPMNLVVSDLYGIAFETYVAQMLPVALACWGITFLVLRFVFRSELWDKPELDMPAPPAPFSLEQVRMMFLLGAVLLSYPVMGHLGWPIWAVAAAGALVALFAFRRATGVGVGRLVTDGVSWDTLAFLAGVLVLALGLQEVGLVERLTGLYRGAGVGLVGTASTLGSAILNNHPMAYLNMLALESAGAPDRDVLAALVGGDLGPRLLPMGSLAGLLWLESLRRQGVHIRLRTFFLTGLAVTVPCLIAALWILSLG